MLKLKRKQTNKKRVFDIIEFALELIEPLFFLIRFLIRSLIKLWN